MLVIHDEALVKRLELLAEREQQSVEVALKIVLDQLEASANTTPDPVNDVEDAIRQERIQRLKARMYAQARDYWAAHDNPERAAMTDADFEAAGFWGFDMDGVPYLNDDVDENNPPHNPLLVMALHAPKSDQARHKHATARNSREILDTDFIEHLMRYRKDKYGKG